MKDFFKLREAKASAQFTDHTPDKDFNDLAKKHKVKVTHDKNDEKTTIHGDEKAVLSVLKTMYGNDWKDMYTKKGSTYVDESVDLEENKIFFVKVGDGRGSMTIKTKATNSREALKKMRSEHPKSRVSLDINQKQGQPAGALESVKTEDKGQFIYAAKQAKKKGDSTFVFAGKTYNCEEVLENEDLDEAVNMGPWNRGAINKAMGKAGIKGKMAKDFIAALRASGTVDEK